MKAIVVSELEQEAAMDTQDEIVKRVITDCIEGSSVECRFWRCQKANACRKHEYVLALSQIMDGLEAQPPDGDHLS